MFTFKISWPTDFLNYSVYTGDQYVVCGLDDGTIQLLINGCNNICLGKGARVYVMNETGATVDKIHNTNNVKPPLTDIPSSDSSTFLRVNPDTGQTESVATL